MSEPACSVVVPTRDRRASLERAVAALLRQKAAFGVELIVVDDGSRDDTPRLIAQLAGEGRVVPLHTSGVGPAGARNAGLAAARARIVALTDDDCEVPEDWVARLLERLSATGAVAVGGRVVAAADTPRPARVSQAITNGFVRAANRDPADAAFLTSNNVAYRAEALRAQGGFDPTFTTAGGEERDLHERLRGRGGRLVYADDIVVVHRPALSWNGFVAQQAAYGRGARRLFSKRRDGARPRHFGPATYARAYVSAFAEVGPGDWAALAAGLAASQAAVLTGYLLGPSR